VRTLSLDLPRPGVALLTLRRPESLNALSDGMFVELNEVAGDLRTRGDLRAVVLTGAGDGFCAGYDLDAAAELPTRDLTQLYALQDLAVSALQAVHTLPCPVIAAVHGVAAGGGFSLALATDIRLAATSARFQAVFVRIGLSGGDLGASWLLPRLVGAGLAAEILYTGRVVGAEEAVRIGLANRAVPEAELLDAALELAGSIAQHPPLGMALTKRSLRANLDAPSFAAALELESRAQVGLLREPSTVEAVEAIRRRWAGRG
jgi:enoyl-CoA hydratase/carnithine racemase